MQVSSERQQPRDRSEHYVPALGFERLTRFYDPLIRATLREATFKTALIQQSDIQPGSQVLDLGCGTGTLTLMIKKSQPKANVCGLDGDTKVIAIAQEKANMAGVEVRWDQAMSYSLPYPDQSFDRVLSSLMFHHLTYDQKIRTFQEILRVLKPGGELHVADWGKAKNLAMRTAFLVVQFFDGFETTEDNVRGKLPSLLEKGGFKDVRVTHTFSTVLGSLSLYKCVKPGV